MTHLTRTMPTRWARALQAAALGTALLLTAAACEGVTLE